MNNFSKGYAAEDKVVDILKSKGYSVQRNPGFSQQTQSQDITFSKKGENHYGSVKSGENLYLRLGHINANLDRILKRHDEIKDILDETHNYIFYLNKNDIFYPFETKTIKTYLERYKLPANYREDFVIDFLLENCKSDIQPAVQKANINGASSFYCNIDKNGFTKIPVMIDNSIGWNITVFKNDGDDYSIMFGLNIDKSNQLQKECAQL